METENKKLGLLALTALVISSSIGSGIFGIASDMAEGTSPGAAIVAWIITGVGVLMLCLALTNIINKRPELSGIFSYATETFGPFGGFISGWGYWLSAWLGNIAFATIMMSALSYFIPALGDGSNLLSIIVASVILWIMCLVVNRGIESAAFLNVITTVCKLVPLLLFSIVAIIAFKADIFTMDFWGTVSGNFSFKDVMSQVNSSMMVLMWVFVGIEGAAMMSDRAKTKKTAGKAYNFAYSLCTAAIFITWILVCVYQMKLSYENRGKKGEAGQLAVGIIGTIFYAWAIWASGIGYFLLCMLVYIIGIFLYVKARKENGAEKVFSKKEGIVILFILLGAAISVYMLIIGGIAV